MKLEVILPHLNDIKEKMPNNLVKVLALILMVKIHDFQFKGGWEYKMTQRYDIRI